MDNKPQNSTKKRKNFFIIAAVFGVTLLGVWWTQKLYTSPSLNDIATSDSAELSIISDYTTPPNLEIAPAASSAVEDTAEQAEMSDFDRQIQAIVAATDIDAEDGVDTSIQDDASYDMSAEDVNAQTSTPNAEGDDVVEVDFNTSSDDDADITEKANADNLNITTQNSLPPSYSPELDILGDNLTVQAVLTATKTAVISGSMDGVILSMPFENGAKFNEGDVLVEYRCDFERARVAEMQARFRLSRRQVEALDRLQRSNTSSEVEYLSAVEQNEQNRALLEQAQAVERRCTIFAPFDGRVMDKEANEYEASRSGRVLMQIGSTEPLRAELLIPSDWLKWVNINTPVSIYVNESGRNYSGKVISIHGEIDPVSRTAHVVVQLDGYQEELLPGMSGRATFQKGDLSIFSGFLGLNLGGPQ